MAAMGAVTIIAYFEMYYEAGFSAMWWKYMLLPIPVVIAVSGYIKYRFRETRAMTMAQFFEIRYSRNFRVFAGFVAFTSGMLNYGVFPGVGARFFQYFFGFPTCFVWLGPFHIDLVYGAIMIVLLLIALALTLWGGLIAVLVTDFIQSMFCNVAFVLFCAYLLWRFDWSQITQALSSAPTDASMINPVHSGGVKNYSVSFFVVWAVLEFYSFMSWQNIQGYYVAAKSPHDAKMSQVLWSLREFTQSLAFLVLPVCIYTYLHHADFAAGARAVQDTLATIPDEQIRRQLTVPIALKSILPVGLMGGFAAVILAAFVSTNDTNLHSWGSIFIQDVLLPLRKKTLSPQAHMRWLRYSMIGVAVFVWLFSLLFNLQQDLLMFFALTGTVFMAGSGAVIIGGLYWKRGTTAGAWAAMTVGVILAGLGWLLTYQWAFCQRLFESCAPVVWASAQEKWPALSGEEFPVNAQILWFYTMVCSLCSYVLVSVLSGWGRTFNINRMLHRGKYHSSVDAPATLATGWRVLAITKEYTPVDKCLYVFSFAYVAIFFGLFVSGTSYALAIDIPDLQWMRFWKIYVWSMLVLGALLSIWLLIGGLHDLRQMKRTLRTARRSIQDDGTVLDHQKR